MKEQFFGIQCTSDLCGDIPWVVYRASSLAELVKTVKMVDKCLGLSVMHEQIASIEVWDTIPPLVRDDEETQVFSLHSGRLVWLLRDGTTMDV